MFRLRDHHRRLLRQHHPCRELTDQIRIVHAQSNGIYGSIKVCKELHRHQPKENIKFRLDRKIVDKLMAAAGTRSKVSKKFRVQTTDSAHDNPIAPNTLNREFTAPTPNIAWVTDITYIHTDQGFLFLAGVMDLFSRKIVGWIMSDTIKTQLIEDALEMASRTRMGKTGLARLVHHSDRGVQYTSGHYREILKMHGIEASMSRKGNCYDNAPM